VTHGVPAWVNVSREFLLEIDPLPLPPHSVVLELLEDEVVDPLLLDRLDHELAAGFHLALDDFTWTPAAVPVLERATYVKLDIRALGTGGFAEQVARLAPYDVTIVAEKVETVEEQRATAALGAQLFQGWYFCRPESLHGRPVPTDRLGALRTAAALSADASFEAVESAIVTDPGLSVRVLRYLASAAVGLPNRVDSVRQALVLLGAATVRQWALLIALGDLAGRHREAYTIGLQRARSCELIARRLGAPDPDAFFLVGLFSVLDVLLDRPLADALADLPLSDAVKAAVLRGEGQKGEVLRDVVAREQGAAAAGSLVADVFEESLVWSDSAMDTLGTVTA
jgi:EAL and modified HD-GYP domain-containing signal transduction protein